MLGRQCLELGFDGSPEQPFGLGRMACAAFQHTQVLQRLADGCVQPAIERQRALQVQSRLVVAVGIHQHAAQRAVRIGSQRRFGAGVRVRQCQCLARWAHGLRRVRAVVEVARLMLQQRCQLQRPPLGQRTFQRHGLFEQRGGITRAPQVFVVAAQGTFHRGAESRLRGQVAVQPLAPLVDQRRGRQVGAARQERVSAVEEMDHEVANLTRGVGLGKGAPPRHMGRLALGLPRLLADAQEHSHLLRLRPASPRHVPRGCCAPEVAH